MNSGQLSESGVASTDLRLIGQRQIGHLAKNPTSNQRPSVFKTFRTYWLEVSDYK